MIPIYLGNMDRVYYLYDGNIEEDIVKTILAMDKELIGVRTKCDPDDHEGENSKLKVQDFDTFQSMGVKQPVVFFTSKKGGADNGLLL
jgi:hypothetical protein